jgi:TonB-linked SusC/RagA family outer membrane protein
MRFVRWRLVASIGAALLSIAAAARSATAQGTITGRVTSASNDAPLFGARVLVVGANASAVAGEDGKFTMRNVGAGNVEVQVLAVGFQSTKKRATVTNGGTVIVDFQLPIAVIQLQDVVITATGQQRRVELGNAVATLGDVGKRVENSTIGSVGDLLLAKAAGVSVLPATTLGGAPTIRVRGSSSISLTNAPIYYVDGVRYSSGTLSSGTDTQFSLLNTLNPEEIEDIEIVKGPSAATLYGTNAANGVVLITTKKGRAGTTRINWFGEQGNVVDNSRYQPMYANWGHSPSNPSVAIRCQLSTMNTSAFTPNTCISDSVTHYTLLRDHSEGDGPSFVHTGNKQLYGMQINGGNEAVRYFASGSISSEVGPVQMPGYELRRYDSLHVGVRPEWFHPLAQNSANFRANFNAALSPTMDLSVNAGFSKTDNRIPPESDLIIALWYVQMQNYGFKGPGLDKITTQSDGTQLHDALQWDVGDIMQYYNSNDLQRMTMSSTLNWRPFSWMQNEGTAGMDLADVDFFHLCRLNECPPQSATARVGNVTHNNNLARNFSAKLASTSTWNPRPWANLKTSIGADYTNIENSGVSSSGTTLPPGASTVAAAATRSASEIQPTAVKTLGYYVQEQLALRDRMFLTAALRTDQNSAFGFNFQKVYYPKIQASWIASDEAYFPHYSWLNQFRLRTSWGASGVQPGATSALVTFSASSVSIPARSSTAAGGTDTPSLIASQPGLPNLKPETSAEFEGGFDTQVLNNRVHMEYTYYDKRTKDALISVPIAPSGAPAQLTVLENVGKLRAWGHEVQINIQAYESRNFAADVTLNGSHFSSSVLDLGIDPVTHLSRVIGAGGTTREIVGYPIFSQWYHPYTYSDVNHDGIIQKSEVHVDTSFAFRGYNTSRDIFSVTTGFDLFQRKLRITMFFDYKGGGNSVDGANSFQCTTPPYTCGETQNPNSPLALQARAIAKTYGSTELGCVTSCSILKAGASGYFQPNQFWKFRELSATYQLPSQVLRPIKAQNGSSIVLSARNLNQWTQFTGIDPEANYGLSQTDTQAEFQTAAAPTYWTLRLNLRY